MTQDRGVPSAMTGRPFPFYGCRDSNVVVYNQSLEIAIGNCEPVLHTAALRQPPVVARFSELRSKPPGANTATLGR